MICGYSGCRFLSQEFGAESWRWSGLEEGYPDVLKVKELRETEAYSPIDFGLGLGLYVWHM